MCVVELQIDKWFLMQIFICLYKQYFFSTGLFKLTIRAFSLRALLNHMESITNRNLDSNNKRLDLILKVAQRNVWIQLIIWFRLDMRGSWNILEMGDPQVTMNVNTKVVQLGWFGVIPILGNFHMGNKTTTWALKSQHRDVPSVIN